MAILSLRKVPPEILALIFSFSSPVSNPSLVCQEWYEALGNSLTWEQKLVCEAGARKGDTHADGDICSNFRSLWVAHVKGRFCAYCCGHREQRAAAVELDEAQGYAKKAFTTAGVSAWINRGIRCLRNSAISLVPPRDTAAAGDGSSSSSSRMGCVDSARGTILLAGARHVQYELFERLVREDDYGHGCQDDAKVLGNSGYAVCPRDQPREKYFCVQRCLLETAAAVVYVIDAWMMRNAESVIEVRTDLQCLRSDRALKGPTPFLLFIVQEPWEVCVPGADTSNNGRPFATAASSLFPSATLSNVTPAPTTEGIVELLALDSILSGAPWSARGCSFRHEIGFADGFSWLYAKLTAR